jgi:two-component sensor histidine kinase
VATFEELVRETAELDASSTGHLRRLVGSWSVLADFCFADLLLFVPVAGSEGRRFRVVGQIRPTTGPTLYRDDLIGTEVSEADRPLVARCWRLEEIVEGEVPLPSGERARVQCIPVRWRGRSLAVLTRESAPNVGRRQGELERKYLEISDRLARMVAEGEFPFATEDATVTTVVPRVGDGVITLDATRRIEFASPNAVSALHRMGIYTNVVGQRLADLGVDESAVRGAFGFGVPVVEEVDRGPDLSFVMRCIPLLSAGRVEGAVVLVRDVSDLRRRDRLLLSKDAAIREVHHRVKNNLQTISSLLRLQARRTSSPEAHAAIEESVRRIRSIALVHETLSRAPGEQVTFDEIVRPLVRMVEEGLVSDERPVQIEVRGEAGEIHPQVATPLAVVVTELLQNAVDHAFRGDPVEPGRILVEFKSDGDELVLRVHDNGVGLPPGFDIERSGGLGLTIVRALVTADLGGTIAMHDDGGTLVELRVPLRPALPVDR